MTALLLIHGILMLIAIRRGWRLAPLALLGLTWGFGQFGPALPELTFAGWFIPFTTLMLAVAGASTCALLYTALAEPEPA